MKGDILQPPCIPRQFLDACLNIHDNLRFNTTFFNLRTRELQMKPIAVRRTLSQDMITIFSTSLERATSCCPKKQRVKALEESTDRRNLRRDAPAIYERDNYFEKEESPEKRTMSPNYIFADQAKRQHHVSKVSIFVA